MTSFSLYSNISYFLKYELIFKHAYKSLYLLPKLRSIILTSPLNYYFTHKNSFGIDLTITSIFQLFFFIFYYSFSVLPYITIKKNLSDLTKNYFLKIIFNTPSSIFNFLLAITLNSSGSFLNFSKILKFKTSRFLNSLSISLVTSGFIFKNFEEFLQVGFLKILLKDLKFTINLLFFNAPSTFNLILFTTLTNSWLI